MIRTSDAVKELFEERKKFIIIGLTGRTGSGCTTTANLLAKDWTELKAPKPQSGTFSSNEERKYRILFDFAKENWDRFHPIQIKDVITFFILLEPFANFANFVSNLVSKSEEEQFRIVRRLSSEVETEYTEYHQRLSKLPKLNEDSTDLYGGKREDCLNFYFSSLPNFSNKLKGMLNTLSQNIYTKVYQVIGDNIRSSGNALNNEFSPSHIFSIAKSTNRLIKLLRHSNNDEALVVIDTIRNPFEATFFRDRYSAFYLVAINCPNEDRIKRLQSSYDYSPSQVREIDKKEYENKLDGDKFFVSQNIGRCIEISDLHFPNPNHGEYDLSFLKRQLVWYISLIMHPGLVTPTSYEHAMQIAYNARLGSGCISRQVGAVVTDEHLSIKSVGWNNTPRGQVPCVLRNATNLIKHDDKQAYSDYENNNREFRQVLEDHLGTEKISGYQNMLKGRNVCFCFKTVHNSLEDEKNQVHTRALHAEENAFLQISKFGGQGLKGGLLFTTASPCELCSKKAYQLGIKEIIYIDPYPDIAGEHVLGSGQHRPKLTLFSGAIGRGYNQLFQPILPYKDELEMLLEFKWPNKKKDLKAENIELNRRIQELEEQLLNGKGTDKITTPATE